MIKISIIGATGYTGQELVRMLSRHSQVQIVGLGSQSYVGQPYDQVYPNLRGFSKACLSTEDPALIDEADVVFLALPHGLSLTPVSRALEKGKKVIDLGADFRLKDPAVYEKWYKHPAPEQSLLQKAVYGLPEIRKEEIARASILANPGCYPTTVLLGLAPLLKNNLIEHGSIIADSKSGVSGAGRGLSLTTHFCETNEDFKAYGLPHHRHLPEMEQELSQLAGAAITITFTPHLLPLTRGMLSTIYCQPKSPLTEEEIRRLYRDFYQGRPFVRVMSKGEIPHTKWVLGTNCCDIGLYLDDRTGKLTIISVIDNLVKGASGQAIQNMNIMMGLEETEGLALWGLYP